MHQPGIGDVGVGESDVAVDELEIRSWHGQEIGLGDLDPSAWVAYEAWIVTNGVGAEANQVMQLNHLRADPSVDQVVQSPLLYNGMGLMEYDYRVLNPPAKARSGTLSPLDSMILANSQAAE